MRVAISNHDKCSLEISPKIIYTNRRSIESCLRLGTPEKFITLIKRVAALAKNLKNVYREGNYVYI